MYLKCIWDVSDMYLEYIWNWSKVYLTCIWNVYMNCIYELYLYMYLECIWKVSEMYLKYIYLKCIRTVSELYLTCILKCVWNSSEIHPTCIQKLSHMYHICIRHVFDMYLKFLWNVSEIYLKSIWNLFEMYLKCVWDVSDLYGIWEESGFDFVKVWEESKCIWDVYENVSEMYLTHIWKCVATMKQSSYGFDLVLKQFAPILILFDKEAATLQTTKTPCFFASAMRINEEVLEWSWIGFDSIWIELDWDLIEFEFVFDVRASHSWAHWEQDAFQTGEVTAWTESGSPAVILVVENLLHLCRQHERDRHRFSASSVCMNEDFEYRVWPLSRGSRYATLTFLPSMSRGLAAVTVDVGKLSHLCRRNVCARHRFSVSSVRMKEDMDYRVWRLSRGSQNATLTLFPSMPRGLRFKWWWHFCLDAFWRRLISVWKTYNNTMTLRVSIAHQRRYLRWIKIHMDLI